MHDDPDCDDATEPPAPSARQLLLMARGFGRLFWGIPLTLLLFMGVLSIRLFPGLQAPPYVLGSLLNAWGAYALWNARPNIPAWSRLSSLLAAAVLFQVYFSPFVVWWKEAPHSLHLGLNVLGVAFSTLALLFLLIRLAGHMARSLGFAAFAAECRFCSWAVVGLMAAPLLYGLGQALRASMAHSTPLMLELLQYVQEEIPLWVLAGFTATFAMGMAAAWKAKEICLNAIAAGAD